MSQQPIPQQMKTLEAVQELDLKLDALKKSRAELPVALKTADKEVAKAQAQLDAKKAAIGELEKTLRQTRAAQELNRDREQRSMQRLEAVRNSTEFAAANKEVDQLKKMNAQLEEQAKKSEADIAGAQNETKSLEAKVAEAQKARDEKASAVTGQGSTLDGQIAELQKERDGIAVNVEKRILMQYDRIRGARAGVGVSPAIGGRCQACNMVVPPQMFNELLQGRNVMHQCPSCFRLLSPPSAPASQVISGPQAS